MEPVHFGTGERRLAGMYHGPAGGYSQKAFLLLNPIGQEAIRVFRLYRELAERLSRAGAHVFRFDYYGCGDSRGESADWSVAGWLQDIETAARELLDTAATERLALIGTRLGASLAWLALPRLGRVERTVLLDPVIDGGAWLEAARAAHAIMLRDPERFPHARSPAEAAGELLGFEMPETLLTEIAAVNLCAASGSATDVEIVATGGREACAPFQARLAELDIRHGLSEVPVATRWDDGTALEHTLIAPELTAAIVERAMR